MKDLLVTICSVVACVVVVAINCMIYALPVMLGIWLWNAIF